MVERGIAHREVVQTIERGIKIDEVERKRAIQEVKKGRFITVLFQEQRKHFVVLTAFESGLTDIRIYRRMKK